MTPRTGCRGGLWSPRVLSYLADIIIYNIIFGLNYIKEESIIFIDYSDSDYVNN